MVFNATFNNITEILLKVAFNTITLTLTHKTTDYVSSVTSPACTVLSHITPKHTNTVGYLRSAWLGTVGRKEMYKQALKNAVYEIIKLHTDIVIIKM
jgi:hypothetical protein